MLSWWLFSICAVSSEVFGWVQMTSLCGCLQNTVAVRVSGHVQMFKAEWLNAGKKVLIRGSCLFKHRREERRFFIRHIHNYTEYNQQWNLCSAFNPSKCTHTRSSVKPMGSSWGFGALLKGLTLSSRGIEGGENTRYSLPVIPTVFYAVFLKSCFLEFIYDLALCVARLCRCWWIHLKY